MAPSVSDDSDIHLSDYPSGSSSNTSDDSTTSTPRTSATSSSAIPSPESLQPPNPSIPVLDRSTSPSPSTSTSATNQHTPSSPAQRPQTWGKKIGGFIWSRLKAVDRNIALVALITAAAVAYPAYKAWKVTVWTAHKDYYSYCRDNIDNLAAEDRLPCEGAIAKGLPPPPALLVRSIKPVMPVYDVIARHLYRRLSAPANSTITAPNQAPPRPNIYDHNILLVLSNQKAQMGDTFSVCVTVGSFVPVAASVVWSAKFRREHASAVAEYLEYCMDLTRGDKGYLVCQTTLQNSKEQKHDLGDTIVIALVMVWAKRRNDYEAVSSGDDETGKNEDIDLIQLHPTAQGLDSDKRKETTPEIQG
ncbi:hypothetical protein K505DRAFT_378643 [Melanomma pulvis-pyrius CBS 109.77]|uniref:Uncharacterized protein n=1 Tax=Melanomma pulvis-pyrius CBS 109.77 TaxID=1314802 RepID=A0A6A6WY38_9PLEO|nr:hypothetical protein K505DRAFT_378643 [Melanomma pulvis-pyrius CBS 109.77]